MILFFLLSAVLIITVLMLLLYPQWRGRHRMPDDDPVLSAYRERLEELEREHADGLLSEADLHEAIDELERELLQNRTSSTTASEPARNTSRPVVLSLTLAIAVVAVAGALYGVVGAPRMLTTIGNDTLSRERIEQLRAMEPEGRISRLEEWLDRNPESVRGWSLLAQSYRETEAYGDAASTFARARAAGADDAWLIARQAEALLLANDRRFTRSVRRLLTEALEQNPRNGLALMLSGQAALLDGDAEKAIDHWQLLIDTLPEEDQQRGMIERLVERVKQETGLSSGTTAADDGTDTDARLDVRVSLADTLRGDTEPGDTVFVFARAAGDGGPPLAVARSRVDELPARITLDDSRAMTPEAKLSDTDRVVVTARISRSGEAMPQSGDLEGRSEAVAVNNGDTVEVVIDRRLP